MDAHVRARAGGWGVCLPFVYVFAGVLTSVLTVALQQNVCPFLSPLM